MALEQTVALAATNILLCIPRNHLTNTNTHILSLSPSKSNPLSPFRLFSSLPLPLNNTRFAIHKCSIDYNNNNGHYDRLMGSEYPRPSEIQWKKELCNSVQLIGIVVTPVQIKPLSSSKVVTWSRLSIKKSSTDTACKVKDGLTSASSTNLNKQGPLPSIKLVRKQFDDRYAISSEEFTSEVVGAKSRNIGYLKGKVLSWVGIPTSVVLPFGVFEKVLSNGLNQLAESCREVTTTEEKLRRMRHQCPKGVAQDSFKGFCTILVG